MRKITKITEGVFSTLVDMSLFTIFFGISGDVTGKAALKMKDEINYDALKRSYKNLEKKGLVQVIKEKNALPKITEEGKKRLASILPKYNKNRTWDGRIYLVIYDVPKEKNKVRDYLRNYLIKIGCGMLQDSVWLTPYNPKKLIEEFIIKYKLDFDSIIISSIGKDGTVGELELTDLVVKVYKLQSLNARYNEFLKTKSPMDFLSVLKDDPQLPFDLLPDWWVGDEANIVFNKLTF